MSDKTPAPDSEEVTLTGLDPQQQLAVAAHLQARTLSDWHPHVARALETQAERDGAVAESHRARAEAWRAVGALARHPVSLSVYAAVLLAWGVGSAMWATGITAGDVGRLLPSVTWGEEAPAASGPDAATQP